MKKQSTDALIIGGGPAGLAAAIALADRGAKCTVIDFKAPPIDKPCGEGLMPDSLKELAKLGIELPKTSGFTFDGIRFKRGKYEVESSFPQGEGLGVRRTVLHKALMTRAEQSKNVSLIWNSRVSRIESDSICIGDREFSYDWLIGADGINSAVRKWATLDVGEASTSRYGFRSHYLIEPWTSRMELHWADVGQMYVTPVSEAEVCVVFLSRDKTLRFDQVLQHFPELKERLSGACLSSKLQGAITATRTLRSVSREKTALIGDASGSVDAITGEGLASAFRQALALADALERDDLTIYAQAHKSLAKLPTRMAQLMLLLDRLPGIQDRIVRALSMTPDSFGNLLSAHVGHQSLPLTICREIPKVAWNFFATEQTSSSRASIPFPAPVQSKSEPEVTKIA